jgi:hypothetical protein
MKEFELIERVAALQIYLTVKKNKTMEYTTKSNLLKQMPFSTPRTTFIDNMIYLITNNYLSIERNGNKSIVSIYNPKAVQKKQPTKMVLAESDGKAQVKLTQSEYEKLADKHGKAMTDKMIEVLHTYKLSSGKTYVSDYAAILNWVVDRVQKDATQNLSYKDKEHMAFSQAFKGVSNV